MTEMIEYFCNLCGHYIRGECGVATREEQEIYATQGNCNWAEIHGTRVEMLAESIRIDGIVLRRGSKELASALSKLKKSKRKSKS